MDRLENSIEWQLKGEGFRDMTWSPSFVFHCMNLGKLFSLSEALFFSFAIILPKMVVVRSKLGNAGKALAWYLARGQGLVSDTFFCC